MNAQNISTAAGKLGLIIALLLALTLQTNAAVTITVDSNPVGSEITIAPGDTVTIGVYDSVGSNGIYYLDFYPCPPTNYVLSNPFLNCPEGMVCAAVWLGDFCEYEIQTQWPPTVPPTPGTIFQTDLEFTGPEDVTIQLVDGMSFAVLKTLTIHQVEPPPLYGPQISINGVAINGVSEITVDTGSTISIGIHDDLGNAPPDAFTAYLDFDPNDPQLYTLSNPQLGAAAGDAAAFTGPDPTPTANQYQIDQAWSTATPSIGSIVTVDDKAETEGGTVINLWDSRTGLGAPVDTMTIRHDPGCWTGDAASREVWESVGSPECWCKSVNPRQCHGDADGGPQGRFDYYASTFDLNILTDAWNKNLTNTLAGSTGITQWICADFDRMSQGRFLYRVGTDDLDILSAWWQIPGGPPPDCEDVIGPQAQGPP